jgi:hypothetical protein
VGGIRRHGYPDPDYLRNCNDELDGLSVPAAQELDDHGILVSTNDHGIPVLTNDHGIVLPIEAEGLSTEAK